MSKQVLVSRERLGVWETLEDAAKELGVSVSTISRKVREGEGGWRYVQRVYAIEVKGGGWTVAVMDSSNRRFVTMSQDLRKIAKKDVLRVKDVTVSWYSGM